MSLIKCTKCGKDISSKATKCVHCGLSLKNKESEKISKNDKKKIIVLTAIAVITFLVIIAVYFIINQDKVEELSLEEILSKYTWISDNEGVTKINFDNFSLDSDYYNSGSCTIYSDFINKNPSIKINENSCLVTTNREENSLKVLFTSSGRSGASENMELKLKFNKETSELELIDNADTIYKKNLKEVFPTTKEEPYFKTYNITNKYKEKKAYLDLYRDNYCEISFKDFAGVQSLGGGTYINITYNDGECTYEKVGDLDFIIKYKGTFSTTVNVEGLNKPQYNYVFQTENQEMKITFEDMNYKDFTITNGVYDSINGAIYFKSK